VDLWAEWCGPCKQLGPILEQLATEANGAFVLAKVDVDANPQLSAALQVQSIPMVVAVVAGQVADGFLGAMPEPQVRGWIGQVMQVAQQLGLQPGAAPGGPNGGPQSAAQGSGQPGPGQPGFGQPNPGQPGFGQPGPGQSGPGQPGGMGGPGDPNGAMADPAFAEAQAAMERGDLDGAARAFEKVLATTPGHPLATMGLNQVDLLRRVSSYDQAGVRQAASDHPDDVEAQARAADVDLATGRIDDALDRLLDAVRRTTGAERDQARTHLLRLFEVFPPRDPRVSRARATLSSLLF
jgi:thioredoxin